jgi:hypothetical protein
MNPGPSALLTFTSSLRLPGFAGFSTLTENTIALTDDTAGFTRREHRLPARSPAE